MKKLLKKIQILFFVFFIVPISFKDTVSAMEIETSDGEKYELSDTSYLSPIDELLDIKSDYKNIFPVYGNYYRNNLEVIVGNNDLKKVADTLVYPFSTSCYLDINNGNARGSANLIGDNILLTAAHNVYNNENNSYNDIYVIPAANVDNQPFGKIKVQKIYIIDDYKSKDYNLKSKSDLALLVIDEPLGAKLGSLGLYGGKKSFLNKNITITGYPSFNFSEKQMYTDSKTITKDNGDFLEYEVDTLGGSSGSCVYDSDFFVLGVHVLGNAKESKNTAVKLNEKNLKFINSIISSNYLNGWKKIKNSWYYYLDGSKVNGWKQIEGKWYYLSSSGEMKTGWQQVEGKWYYLLSSGEMKTGWQQVEGKWYYLLSSGEMKTGWQQVEGKWYYLSSSGEMKTGWQQIEGKWYYLSSSGEMKTGWQQIESKWYYLSSSGVMVTGSHTIDGKIYKFDSSGALVN